MAQTRLMSFIEAITNLVVGFIVALLTQMVVFPLFGIEAGAREHVSIACVFTMVSLVRSYTLRRVFEVIRARRSPPSLVQLGTSGSSA